LAIELTDEEKALAARIDFDDAGHTPLVSGSCSTWQTPGRVDALPHETGAIPKARKKSSPIRTTDVGGMAGRGFRSSSATVHAASMFSATAISVKYLRISVRARSAQSVIEEFQRKVISSASRFTGSRCLLRLSHLRGRAHRSHSLDTRKAPVNSTNLRSMRLDASDARSVRDSRMQ